MKGHQTDVLFYLFYRNISNFLYLIKQLNKSILLVKNIRQKSFIFKVLNIYKISFYIKK